MKLRFVSAPLIFLALTSILPARPSETVNPLGVTWVRHLDQNLRACLLLPGQNRLAYSTGPVLGLLDSKSGKLLWSQTAEAEQLHFISSKDGGYLLGLTSDKAFALDIASGKQLWQLSCEQAHLVGRSLFGIMGETKHRRLVYWELPGTLQQPPSAPVVLAEQADSILVDPDFYSSPGALVHLNSQGVVQVLNPAGKLCWERRFSKPRTAGFNSLIHIEFQQHKGDLGMLQGRDLQSGKSLWSISNTPNLVYLDDQSFLTRHETSAGQEVRGYSVKTGKLLWATRVPFNEFRIGNPGEFLLQQAKGFQVRSTLTGQLLRQGAGELPVSYLRLGSSRELIALSDDGKLQNQDSISTRLGNPSYMSGRRVAKAFNSPDQHILTSPNLILSQSVGPSDPKQRIRHEFQGPARLDLSGVEISVGQVPYRLTADMQRLNSCQLHFQRLAESGGAPRWETVETRVLNSDEPYNDYEQKTLQFNPKSPGRYRVITTIDGKPHQHEFRVSNIGMISKTHKLEKGFAVRVYLHNFSQKVGASKGGPLANSELSLRTPKGEVLARGRTNNQGMADLQTTQDPSQSETAAVVYVEKEKLEIPLGRLEEQSSPIYLRTDRPLYRPGHKVYFYGIAGQFQSNQCRFVENQEVTVTARDVQDNVVYTKVLKSAANGVFSGEFDLSDDPARGQYRLTASYSGQSAQSASSLPFMVQDYRKPPFEMLAKAEQKLIISGQTLAVEVQCKYFFGSPVEGAKIHYVLEGQNLYGAPGVDDPDAPPQRISEYRYWRQTILEGDCVSDSKGRVKLQLPIKDISQDQLLHLNLTATGSEGQEVSASTSCFASPAEFGVYADTTEWVCSSEKPATINVRTVNRLGKPYSAKVKLAIEAGYGHKKPLWSAVVQTDAQGRAQIDWPKPKPGYLSIQANSKDSRGRAVSSSSSVWVAGAGEEWFAETPSLELIPHRGRYKPGDIMKLLVLTSHPGKLLLSVEGDELHRSTLIDLKRKATLLEIPIKSQFAPGVHLTAHLMNSNLLSQGEVYVPVTDQGHQLKLAVSRDQVEYRPGSSAKLQVETSHQNRPVSASLQVAVVDDALLALQPEFAPHIHKFFYGQRANQVKTNTFWPKDPKAAGFQTIQTPTKVRSEFKDTAFWRTQIQTDSQGRASVDVPLPDNLTRWKASLQAVADPLGVGQTTTEFVTSLPLMVRWATPRFFVDGDRAEIGAVVTERSSDPSKTTSNNTTVALTADEKPLPTPATVDLAAGQSLRVPTRLEVRGNRPIELKAVARRSQEGDAEKIKVPVHSHSSEVRSHFSQTVQGSQAVDFRPSAIADGNLGSAELTVQLSRSIQDHVTPALDYLADFPYGCAEQTMSRFLPTVVAIKASAASGQPIQKPIDAIVRASLDKLYGYQHSDGGWGWWKEDNTHPFMTGYVLYGLSQAMAAGRSVSETTFQRGIGAALKIQSELLQQSEAEARVYLLWSLSQALEFDKEAKAHLPVLTEALQQLASDPASSSLGIYSKALLGEALFKVVPDSPAIAKLKDEMRKSAKTEASGWNDKVWSPNSRPQPLVHWDAQAFGSHGFVDDDIETTCAALTFLRCGTPSSQDAQLIESGIQWLLSQKRGPHWKSTKDTAKAVMTLCRLRPLSAAKMEEPIALSLDGKSLDLKGASFLKLPLDPQISHRLECQSSTPAQVSLELTAQEGPQAGQADLAPASQGIKVSRQYSKRKFKIGDQIVVKLTVESDANYEFLKLEDPRPAGTEVPKEQTELPWSVSRREDHDDRTVFFLTYLRKGTNVFEYKLRAETAGHFTALPAQVELMYQPDIWGRSNSLQVDIESDKP